MHAKPMSTNSTYRRVVRCFAVDDRGLSCEEVQCKLTALKKKIGQDRSLVAF